MSNSEPFLETQHGEAVAISEIRHICIHSANDNTHVALWGAHGMLLAMTAWADPLEGLSFLNKARAAVGLPEYVPPTEIVFS